MKVYLHSIGCRLNQSEIETMARQLLASGHEIVGSPDLADKAIINTCAVTNQAEKDSRSIHRRIRQSSQEAEIYVTGCYATIKPQSIEVTSGRDHLVLNPKKDDLVQILEPNSKSEAAEFDKEPILREYLNSPFGNTRAFVKVQDGCDNRCTFCITTVARGQGKSRQLTEIVDEIRGLAAAGYQEAVLTGVHLGSYGKDLGEGTNLHALVEAILDQTALPRLRLSSLEPWDLEAGFFDLWQDKRLLPHLHMPLQSGSDSVLRRMARRTSRRSYLQLAQAARAAAADLSLSTDIITGFPGESEEEFEDSLEFVSRIGFSRLHVFSYSNRPGTAAAEMPGHLHNQTIKERTHRMIKLGNELSLSFHQGFEGKKRTVLWERSVGASEVGLDWLGYTDNYIRVRGTSKEDLFNRATPTWLDSPESGGMRGVMAVSSPEEVIG